MELIFKMEPGLYAIIHLIRASEGELLRKHSIAF